MIKAMAVGSEQNHELTVFKCHSFHDLGHTYLEFPFWYAFNTNVV